jgi:hypothetical protein
MYLASLSSLHAAACLSYRPVPLQPSSLVLLGCIVTLQDSHPFANTSRPVKKLTMEPGKLSLTTWTSFELQKSIVFNTGDVFGRDSDIDPSLLEAVRLLSNATGHKQSDWGRVTEQPQKIILVTCKYLFTAISSIADSLQYGTLQRASLDSSLVRSIFSTGRGFQSPPLRPQSSI